MKILKYSTEYKNGWDDFITSSKNSHFFFKRDYMDYHSDRFDDFSLMFHDEKDKLIAVLPANKKNDILYSHQGLTFGGIIVNDKMTTEIMLHIFDSLKSFLKENNFSKLVYKCIPYTYHLKPTEEDRYALFINEAELIRRDVSSTIDLSGGVRYSKGRKWSVNKAKKEDLQVVETTDYEFFWKLLESVLEAQHGSKPIHSLEEIKELANSFPKNIKLYLASKNEEILCGAVIYENKEIVHTQYLANSLHGRDIGALDFLLDYLINDKYKEKKFFDFGISNEQEGKVLNTGLIAQKEGFGARAVVHDFYEMNIT